MARFVKNMTKLALKSVAVCSGIAAGAVLLHKYVKIQSNCSGCSKEDDFDEDADEVMDEFDTSSDSDETSHEDESDAISSDEAADSSNRGYIKIHVSGKNSDVDINIDKERFLDDAAKLVSDAAQLTKNLMSASHFEEVKSSSDDTHETADVDPTDIKSDFNFTDMNASCDINDLDLEDLHSQAVSDDDISDTSADSENSSIHL